MHRHGKQPTFRFTALVRRKDCVSERHFHTMAAATALRKVVTVEEDSLYEIAKVEMPEYMKKAFHTGLLKPDEKEPTEYYEPDRQRKRFVDDVIIANFYDYALCRTKLGARACDVMEITEIYKQNGYFSFDQAFNRIEGSSTKNCLDSKTSFAILSTVPDSLVLEALPSYRWEILDFALIYYNRECNKSSELSFLRDDDNDNYNLPDLEPCDNFAWPLIAAATAPTNFTSRLVGRLWLMPAIREFYDGLLRTIVTLPHQTLWKTEERDEISLYVRRHTSRSMLLVLLARIANDLFEPSFNEEVIDRGLLDDMYRLAMVYGCTSMALVLGLFVDSDLVASCAELLVARVRHGMRRRDVDANARAALLYLLYVRNVSCQPSLGKEVRINIRDRLFAPIFEKKNDDCPPPTLLELELRRDGLSTVLRCKQHSTAAKNAIYRYFYNVIWMFITTFEKDISLFVRGSISIGEPAVDSVEHDKIY